MQNSTIKLIPSSFKISNIFQIMFRQFFTILLFVALFGTASTYMPHHKTADSDSDEIVARVEQPMKLRTLRPIKFGPGGRYE
ncbi:Neuropeptide-Like Protein [Caenorhabditis elegans]|uniref:Neuropeptide-Like Protein n=1 Tax=Caenorhabditis elegans TaxID=6239 RepID=Q4PIS5_CAEEL|nr:Neuropeptide-Like Protein [Caenorhabditis elegans]CCD70980.1 Neuropeptide-Like Protein [Caenorhabditis elegans]|eukprot:NP_001033425.1 Uncharacterized protein CELE_K11H12.10 [Caenorhabditis elegans]